MQAEEYYLAKVGDIIFNGPNRSNHLSFNFYTFTALSPKPMRGFTGEYIYSIYHVSTCTAVHRKALSVN